MEGAMELRHLRYFVAVAEAGSLTVAAERRLHTAQPSLSRQIRDLEQEVGAPLFTRSVRGIALTPAGQVFLEHARLVLTAADTAIETARRAARPSKPSLALGFLTGQEMDWLPEAMAVLKDQLPSIDVTVSSDISPNLADGLMRGRLDLAFMRAEANAPALDYQVILSEPLVVVLPSDHPLAAREAIGLADIVGEAFLGMSDTAPVLKAIVDGFLAQSGIDVHPVQRVDNLAMVMSLVASTRAVALVPAYVRNFLPWSVASRPFDGVGPSIDLVVGYQRTNASPALRLFLSRLDRLIARCRSQTG
jgi:LysR family hca operon transcriptional activator